MSEDNPEHGMGDVDFDGESVTDDQHTRTGYRS